jgi:hypothetical protein
VPSPDAVAVVPANPPSGKCGRHAVSGAFTGIAAYLIPSYSGICALLSIMIRLAPSRLARWAAGPVEVASQNPARILVSLLMCHPEQSTGLALLTTVAGRAGTCVRPSVFCWSIASWMVVLR